MRGVRAQGHVLLPAGDDDARVAELHRLARQRHRAQTRAAHLVDAVGGGADRDAGIDGCLAGRVLTLGRGQHLAEHDLVDFGRVDARPLQRGEDGDTAQLMGRGRGKGTAEGANRCPRRAGDDDIGHGGAGSVTRSTCVQMNSSERR